MSFPKINYATYTIIAMSLMLIGLLMYYFTNQSFSLFTVGLILGMWFSTTLGEIE